MRRMQAGRQGSKRMGELEVPFDLLPSNNEVTTATSFALRHLRPGEAHLHAVFCCLQNWVGACMLISVACAGAPGTVSLNLSQNDDYPELRQAPNYRDAEFLITTGPGPVPSLDGQVRVVIAIGDEHFPGLGAQVQSQHASRRPD